MKRIAEVLLCAIGFVAIAASIAFVAVIEDRQRRDADSQVRGWMATLDECHRESGKAFKVRIDEPTYDAARKTAATRMHWQEKGFSVSPVVKDYVDMREVEYTP